MEVEVKFCISGVNFYKTKCYTDYQVEQLIFRGDTCDSLDKILKTEENYVTEIM